MKIDKAEFIKAIERFIDKHHVTLEEATTSLMNMGPQRLKRLGLLSSVGWRAGYTKQTLEKRAHDRRVKEKNRRRVRALQRKQKA